MPFSVSGFNSIIIIEANEVPEFPIEYELNFTLTGACITCTFLDSSTTDCVAVVHRNISQLSSSGLMNIESSHKLNRSGDTAYGCIEGVNLTDYQVGAVGVTRQLTTTVTFSESVTTLRCMCSIEVAGCDIFIYTASQSSPCTTSCIGKGSSVLVMCIIKHHFGIHTVGTLLVIISLFIMIILSAILVYIFTKRRQKSRYTHADVGDTFNG